MPQPTRYVKTPTLASARTPTGRHFTGQKAIVIEAILASPRPVTSEEIKDRQRSQYFDRLKGGKSGYVMNRYYGGGEKGLIKSVEFHLRQLLLDGHISRC
jgi:hypothetical protein